MDLLIQSHSTEALSFRLATRLRSDLRIGQLSPALPRRVPRVPGEAERTQLVLVAMQVPEEVRVREGRLRDLLARVVLPDMGILNLSLRIKAIEFHGNYVSLDDDVPLLADSETRGELLDAEVLEHVAQDVMREASGGHLTSWAYGYGHCSF